MTQKPPSKPPSAKTAPTKPASQGLGGWMSDVIRTDIVQNEDAVLRGHDRMLSIIKIEIVIIGILSAILIMGVPFFHPVYEYFALNPKKQRLQMPGLTMPNMTNRAILSWSTTAITEIMTMGFGDYEPHLKAQKFRFTEGGWESFATAFDKQKIGDSFRKHQLVLTTVPSNTPVILAQGLNSKHIYQWNVQMPVVMTYATNNNVSRRQNAIIDLTIVRVPTEQNPAGIGIQTWLITS